MSSYKTSLNKKLMIYAAAIILSVAIMTLVLIGNDWFDVFRSVHLSFRKIGASYIRPFEFPVAVSPDEQFLLIKAKTDDAFSLQIYQGKTMKAKLDLPTNPWEITWSPSGKEIAYLAADQSGSAYDLHMWSFIEGELVTLASPKTHSASFTLKWSPNNQYLAYIVHDSSQDCLVVISVHGRRSYVEATIENILPESSFAWSADSTELVFSQIGSLNIYNLPFHTTRMIANVFGNVHDLSWSPSTTSIAFVLRKNSDKYYALAQLSLTGQIQSCPMTIGDVESPIWLDTAGNIAYIVTNNAEDLVYVAHGCDRAHEVYRPLSGSGRLQNDGYSHKSIYFIEDALEGPPQLKTIRQDLISTPTPFNIPIFPVVRKQIWISATDHLFAAWIWPAATPSTSRKAIIMIHGGPDLHESGAWDPLISAFQKDGFLIMAINYSGSSGYGNEYEKRTNLSIQANELLTTIKYLSDVYDISSKNILVFASSYGSRIALQSLRIDPKMCGSVVFSPFTSNALDVAQSPIDFHGPVLAFHGQKDTISNPRRAHESLRRIFAPAASEHNLYWREFDNEGHGLARISSLQEEFGTIDCSFHSKSCK